MRTAWHELWGSGGGPAARLAPATRIVSGVAVFAACLIAPATTPLGAAVAGLAAGAWLIACRPPARMVGAAVLLGCALFLPYFLLAPLVRADAAVAAGSWRRAFAVPAGVLVRGMSGLLVSTATVASLSAGDLRDGLVQLPLPRIVSAILVQIVHQTATLGYETRRVAAAMAVRGASQGGLAAARVLAAVARVWLPRVIVRAERVAAAMELRGYCAAIPAGLAPAKVRFADGVAIASALGVLGCAAAVRFWGSV